MTLAIALVGRPNVGKSTLFNRLTQSRDALVANIPGLTRDRQYGETHINGQSLIVIDTGGIGEAEQGVDALMLSQSKQAINEADIIFFLVDGRAGRTTADELIAAELRTLQKPIYTVVNKTDGIDPDVAMGDFYNLGLRAPRPITATHGKGVASLMQEVLDEYQPELSELTEKAIVQQGIKIAIVGRPNVGKSTLVNRMLGEERVVVYDQPGTTRDSIFIPMERMGKHYTLIDTAGVRKRGRINETIEKFSIIKTLKAIEATNVVIFMVDAREGIVEQDLNLLSFILDAGKALVIAVNKWDGMEIEEKRRVKKELMRRLQFVDFAKQHFISALHGSDVGNLFTSVEKAYASSMVKLTTPKVMQILQTTLEAHPPPIVHGHRIKLRYAHIGGHNPPIIVIHGNQTESLPESYKRYLVNSFRKILKLVGTPIHIQLKSTENPYAGRKNILTPRQQYKRKRMMKHVKK